MPVKDSSITFTDQFCGVGGNSEAAEQVTKQFGGKVELAMNHWELAIQSHNSNFPNTRHVCTDVQACDPRNYPSTDFLLTSPECTNHSLAKGKKTVKKQMELYASGKLDAAAERSRATMWDVCRFAEYHKYNYIIVENVVDARKWVMFDSWLHAMHALGYQHKCVYFNSMFAWPTPQSRDRMYVHFWRKGNKAPNLDYTPAAYCERCDKDVYAIQSFKNPKVKYGIYGMRGQYLYCCPSCSKVVTPYYYSAFNCIDWSIKGERIGNKNLSPNSRRRIEVGYNKYGNKPLIITQRYGSGIECRIRDGVEQTLPTQPACNTHYLLNPLFVKMEHMKANDESYVMDGTRPLPTQTTSMSLSLVLHPFIVNNTRTGVAKSVNDAFNTFTTVTKQSLLSHESVNAFLSYYYSGSDQVSHILQPAGTFATKIGHSLVQMPGELPPLEECTYRMLQPNEVKAGMAFRNDYIVLGNKEQQVKQLGNAVNPPAMQWQIKRAIETFN